jgi:hypothetical protein
VLGLAVGVFSLIGEMSEGDGGRAIPLSRVLTVAAVFIGSGTAGWLIAYGLLKRPLGLFRQGSQN